VIVRAVIARLAVIMLVAAVRVVGPAAAGPTSAAAATPAGPRAPLTVVVVPIARRAPATGVLIVGVVVVSMVVVGVMVVTTAAIAVVIVVVVVLVVVPRVLYLLGEVGCRRLEEESPARWHCDRSVGGGVCGRRVRARVPGIDDGSRGGGVLAGVLLSVIVVRDVRVVRLILGILTRT